MATAWCWRATVKNALWWQFQQKSSARQQQIALLVQLLEGYRNTNSPVWKQAAVEYEKSRTEYNRWIDSMTVVAGTLYVGHLFRFQRMQPVDWKAAPGERFEKQVAHWFDGFDFNDTWPCAAAR